jgi:hypothetical protein
MKKTYEEELQRENKRESIGNIEIKREHRKRGNREEKYKIRKRDNAEEKR